MPNSRIISYLVIHFKLSVTIPCAHSRAHWSTHAHIPLGTHVRTHLCTHIVTFKVVLTLLHWQPMGHCK